MKRVLIVDDELNMLESLHKILSYRKDFQISAFNDPAKALKELSKNKFDIVISDLRMENHSGIDILQASLKKNPATIVIIISGYGTIESSVEAIKLGAFDFIEKPFTSKKLFEVIDRGLLIKNQFSVDETEDIPELRGIVQNSPAMKEVLNLVRRISPSEMNVLIYGESGTGKELLARAIHKLSKGKNNPFVPVNCGALPEQLFESELFGHEKGAFTGAVKTKPGLLEFAEGGTFFFDEIGELTTALQVKLLRMLEERKIRRVGGSNEISINVRIIAATNKNLENLVSEGTFRDDLFYRLNNMKIEVPPLRERKEDIMPLINQYIQLLCSNKGEKQKHFTPEAEVALINYAWPGNVRELQNVINRTYFLCPNELITIDDLPIPVSKKQEIIDKSIITLSYKEAKERVLESFEIEYLTYHLKRNNGNITKTADECGLDRRSIHRLISRYNILFKD
ncbi:MAG: sigma-54-dependent Fis family transcriptional regulator [Melioribacteraceae bacterium]|nr:sigma-54-dependent Fis family transcriptional regulator [Melioribacteraceae bacterium]